MNSLNFPHHASLDSSVIGSKTKSLLERFPPPSSQQDCPSLFTKALTLIREPSTEKPNTSLSIAKRRSPLSLFHRISPSVESDASVMIPFTRIRSEMARVSVSGPNCISVAEGERFLRVVRWSECVVGVCFGCVWGKGSQKRHYKESGFPEAGCTDINALKSSVGPL